MMSTIDRTWLKSIGSSLLAIAMMAVSGCTLSSGVRIEPLLLHPSDIRTPSSLQDAINRGDYRQAAEMAGSLDPASGKVEDLALLGRAQFYCGRYAVATETLSRALERPVTPELRAQIAWDLAQIAYQQQDTSKALELALEAKNGGIRIKDWYIQLLEAVQRIRVHAVEGSGRSVVRFRFGSPDLPRIAMDVNKSVTADTVLDSGAVMSIVSRSFAERAGIRSLGDFSGEFYGLLGEPIAVQFGLIDSLEISGMTIGNVPVAIMDDSKLRFLVAKNERFDIDFLIGTSFMKEFRLRFDYDRQQLTIDYLEPRDRVPVSNQNLFLVDQRPLVHVTINGRGWYPFLLDSGSEVTFLNRSRFTIENVTYGVPRYHGATMQGLGGTQKSGMHVRDVAIGVDRWDGMFTDMPLYTDERPGAVGILGQNYLKNFFVDIDFGRMRLDLHPIAPEGER